MSPVLFFTRNLLSITLLLFSTQLWAQQVLVCNSCDIKTIQTLPLSQSIQVFKCKASQETPEMYKWGIRDVKGNIIVKPEWDSIGAVGQNMAVVYQYIPQRKKTTLKAGIISFQNQSILPLHYTSIQTLQAPYYKVSTPKGYQVWHEQQGFIHTNIYDSIHVDPILGILLYTDNLCHRINPSTAAFEGGNNKLWLTNDNGRIYSIPYDTLYLYRAGAKGLTPVLGDSIKDSNHPLEVRLYREGKSMTWNFPTLSKAQKIERRNDIQLLNINTLSDSTIIKIKTRTQADTILLLNHLFLFKRNHFWGYGDTVGNVPIAPVYDSLGLMYNDRVAVKIRNKWGFLDRNENIIAQPYYEAVGDYRYGATWVLQNKKYNFLNLSGKVINTHWYERIVETHLNYVVYYKGKAGLVNHLGQEIIGTRYLQILDFGEGACLVQTEDLKWFLMDYKENRISTLSYSYVYYLPHSQVYVLKK